MTNLLDKKRKRPNEKALQFLKRVTSFDEGVMQLARERARKCEVSIIFRLVPYDIEKDDVAVGVVVYQCSKRVPLFGRTEFSLNIVETPNVRRNFQISETRCLSGEVVFHAVLSSGKLVDCGSMVCTDQPKREKNDPEKSIRFFFGVEPDKTWLMTYKTAKKGAHLTEIGFVFDDKEHPIIMDIFLKTIVAEERLEILATSSILAAKKLQRFSDDADEDSETTSSESDESSPDE